MTAAVTPAVAGEHGHGAGAHHGEAAGDMAGMDHGHDGAAGGTAEGWDAVRMSALEGYLPPRTSRRSGRSTSTT